MAKAESSTLAQRLHNLPKSDNSGKGSSGKFLCFFGFGSPKVGEQPLLHPAEDPEDEIGAGELDEAGRDVELVDSEGSGNQHPGHSGQVEEGDDRDKRGGLEEENDFVGV